MRTVFLRALEADDKSGALLEAICQPLLCIGKLRFETDPAEFGKMHGSPFAYWASSNILNLFTKLGSFEKRGVREARVGDHPGDSFRYLRLSWEAPLITHLEWKPYQKGGAYSPFYFDIHLLANWHTTRQTYRGFIGRPGRANLRPSNYQYFMRPGAAWPLRTNGLSFRAMPSGCIFSHKGPVAF